MSSQPDFEPTPLPQFASLKHGHLLGINEAGGDTGIDPRFHTHYFDANFYQRYPDEPDKFLVESWPHRSFAPEKDEKYYDKNKGKWVKDRPEEDDSKLLQEPFVLMDAVLAGDEEGIIEYNTFRQPPQGWSEQDWKAAKFCGTAILGGEVMEPYTCNGCHNVWKEKHSQGGPTSSASSYLVFVCASNIRDGKFVRNLACSWMECPKCRLRRNAAMARRFYIESKGNWRVGADIPTVSESLNNTNKPRKVWYRHIRADSDVRSKVRFSMRDSPIA
ncbi:hypothetical protein BJ508DRAFT_347796 [Ascobolus immersus RN42]|uniref:Uncharacterized protein n=1 Tax=Ascobolus immersus RN42 TaxID=1160509 RepID=A0A3N4IL72_ASCIM|nr:hypothetical protein BJ508DRAFT_347796 [Ascobolus immersus RN42]